jgi:hypothetical protein
MTLASPIPSAGNSERPIGRAALPSGGDPFDAGPFAWASHPSPLAPAWTDTFWHRGLATALVAWVPLALLSASEGLAIGPSPHESLLLDLAAYGRYVVAAPAFACAGQLALPHLALVVRQFTESRIVADQDRSRYAAIVASTRRLLATPWIDVALVAFAYSLTIVVSPMLYPPSASTWVAPRTNGSAHLSLAGWWRTLVSQPLYNVLIGIWLWRLLLWTRFLHQTCRLHLRLVASHPDRLGGLRFVLMPIGGFAILAFGIGAIGAGSVANRVVVDGHSLASFRYLIGGQVLCALLLFAGPVLLLMRPLIRLRIWGTFHYGWLATEVGHAFQDRWLIRTHRIDRHALGAPDFSATTDLYAIVANVRAMNPLVLDLSAVAMVTVATLLPYVPLLLAVMPLDDILRFALKAVT